MKGPRKRRRRYYDPGANPFPPNYTNGAGGKPKTKACIYCSCTEEYACPGGCSWISTDPLVCSNPECQKAFEGARAALARAQDKRARKAARRAEGSRP